MPGLYRAMCEDGVELAGEEVIILGAGGVARAVAMLLAEKKTKHIIVMNRTPQKAEQIAAEVNRLTGTDLVEAMALADYTKLSEDRNYLCIQATNVGMFPKTEEAVMEEESFYRRIHTGYDLIYNPIETRFMKLVKQSGGRAFNGLKMLLWQGVIAYELWTGKEIGKEQADLAYVSMKKAMGIVE